MMNGFRRFFNKACKESLSNESPLAALIKKEYMMGHAGLVKLDRNYFKTHVLELAAEYSDDQKFLLGRDVLLMNFMASSLGRAVLKYSDKARRICTTVE